MRRAERAREIEPCRVDVDGYDRRRTDDRARHHRAQADGADAEHREALTGTHIERVHDRAGAGLKTATQRAEQFERDVARHDDRVALGRQRVRGERGLLEERTKDRVLRCRQGGAAVAAPARIAKTGCCGVDRVVLPSPRRQANCNACPFSHRCGVPPAQPGQAPQLPKVSTT